MLNKLTKKQIELMPVIRDKWINLALHEQKYDKEEIEAGVKWMYYISDLKEPKVVIVKSPKDFTKKLRASVGASVGASVWASVRVSVGDSVGASVWDSVGASVGDSVGDSVGASVGASVRASVWDSVWASVSYCSLVYDADDASWYDYFKTIKAIKPQENADKYYGYLQSGIFYCMFFEKVAYVILRPTLVKQDERKRLHSTNSPSIAWSDETEEYYLHGVKFEKKWWTKIVEDKMSPQEIFAIDNLEHRRIAYEFMDKSKMSKLKDYKILDEQIDEKGNPMKIISFNVKGINEPLKYYQCVCPSTKREYFIGTDQDTCKDAKLKSFGLEEGKFIEEW
jgi:hypothetical protein